MASNPTQTATCLRFEHLKCVHLYNKCSCVTLHRPAAGISFCWACVFTHLTRFFLSSTLWFDEVYTNTQICSSEKPPHNINADACSRVFAPKHINARVARAFGRALENVSHAHSGSFTALAKPGLEREHRRTDCFVWCNPFDERARLYCVNISVYPSSTLGQM